MKKLVLIAVAMMASVMLAATEAPKLTLAEARGQIAKCVKSPDKMKEIMKQLSAADQKAFLADVHAAIADLPGSDAMKAPYYLAVDRAALESAAKNNISELVAEIFATLPPNVMTVANEDFAQNVFARGNGNVSDESFEKMATALMSKVNARMTSVENGAERAGFVILMLVRASGGTPATLTETLIKTLPEGVQATARNDWFPSALGAGVTQSYVPILGGFDAGLNMIANQFFMRSAGPQLLESMLGELVEQTPHINSSIRPDAIVEPLNVEEMLVGPAEGGADGETIHENIVEPQGYQGQLL